MCHTSGDSNLGLNYLVICSTKKDSKELEIFHLPLEASTGKNVGNHMRENVRGILVKTHTFVLLFF